MNAKRAISKIAKENGVSEREVCEEIRKAINEALKNADPQVIEQWKKVPHKEETPTPEEVIEFIARKILEKP